MSTENERQSSRIDYQFDISDVRCRPIKVQEVDVKYRPGTRNEIDFGASYLLFDTKVAAARNVKKRQDTSNRAAAAIWHTSRNI